MKAWLYSGLLLGLVLVALAARPAYAYLDPASTSYIWQTLYWAFYGIVGFVVLCFRHIKVFFAALKARLFRSKP